jgi:hypothetical protein
MDDAGTGLGRGLQPDPDLLRGSVRGMIPGDAVPEPLRFIRD